MLGGNGLPVTVSRSRRLEVKGFLEYLLWLLPAIQHSQVVGSAQSLQEEPRVSGSGWA